MNTKWQTVIGFEIHVELATQSKMFCTCPADHFAKTPNTQTCPVCLGLPGALPVPNAKAIEWCIKLGLALGSKINLNSKFDRKNYFYPDLPKGYQISQYDQPFCLGGLVTLSTGKVIRVTRVHMEEDTAKLQHQNIDGKDVTLVDFNRSGVPLVEIVTEPDFENTEQVTEFLKEMQQIIRAIGISAADMEKGSMRLEANISVRPEGQTELPKYKIEVKNVNSFRFIKKAIEFEIVRQTEILSKGEAPIQETRGFNENTGQTYSQRLKEEAHDYRYFPEPDIPPFSFTKVQIENWRQELPALPEKVRSDLEKLGIKPEKAASIVADQLKFSMYTKLIQANYKPEVSADMIINVPSDIIQDMNKIIAWYQAKNQKTEIDPKLMRETIVKIVDDNPKVVADFKSGKNQAIFSLIGQVKSILGNIDVQQAKSILEEILNSK